MHRLVLTAKALVDGTGRAPLRDPYVVAEEGRIVAMGQGQPPAGLAQDAEQVAMPEATIIPGLVDAHVHLALGLSRPDWAEINADPARLALFAAQGAVEALRAGVTTVADCGARYGVTLPLRDAIARGQVPGARVWACGVWLTVTNGHGYFWTEWGLDSADELRRGVRQMVWQGADFIKIMASGGMTGGAKTNRRRAQYSVAELRAAVEDAHRLNKRVHCHVNAAEAMHHCIEAGVDVVEHCNWLGAEEGTVAYDDQLAHLGAQQGTYAAMNGGDGFMLLQKRDGYAQDWGNLTRWDLFRRMQAAGMRIYVNTDAIGQGFDGLPKLMQRMVDEGRATAAETMQMTTLIPAQALGLAAQIGSLEIGKLADMVLLAANPLEDMATVTRPLAVVKEAKLVVRDDTVMM